MSGLSLTECQGRPLRLHLRDFGCWLCCLVPAGTTPRFSPHTRNGPAGARKHPTAVPTRRAPFLCMNEDKRHREPKPQHLAPAGAKASPPRAAWHFWPPHGPAARHVPWTGIGLVVRLHPCLRWELPEEEEGAGAAWSHPVPQPPCVPVDFALLLSRSSPAAGAPTPSRQPRPGNLGLNHWQKAQRPCAPGEEGCVCAEG